jgi:hypothetical protein
MAFKGTAGVSASGASMSKYDVEVEARLKKLEAAVAALEKHSHDTPAPAAVGTVPGVKDATKGLGVEAKVDALIGLLS